MPQCRDPVVHKMCIRKLDGYLFILNNIVSEIWSLEKRLSSFIKEKYRYPLLRNVSISVVKCFQHRLPNIRKFQHELSVKFLV